MDRVLAAIRIRFRKHISEEFRFLFEFYSFYRGDMTYNLEFFFALFLRRVKKNFRLRLRQILDRCLPMPNNGRPYGVVGVYSRANTKL